MTTLLPLHPLKCQGNRYCGPTAISLLTGISTGEAARVIRAGAGGQIRAVKGTGHEQVNRALALLGLASRELPVTERLTLRRWMEGHGLSGTYLVNITGHWVVVQGGEGVACSRTAGALVTGDAHPNARTVVKRVWRLTRAKAVDVEGVLLWAAHVTGVDTTPDSDRRRARALAKRHGIKIERESGMTSYGVWPPAALKGDDVDPYAGDHYARDWAEILMRVNGYVRALEALLVQQQQQAAQPGGAAMGH